MTDPATAQEPTHPVTPATASTATATVSTRKNLSLSFAAATNAPPAPPQTPEQRIAKLTQFTMGGLPNRRNFFYSVLLTYKPTQEEQSDSSDSEIEDDPTPSRSKKKPKRKPRKKPKKKPTGKECLAALLVDMFTFFLESCPNSTILRFSDSEYRTVAHMLRRTKKIPTAFADLLPYFDDSQNWKIRDEKEGASRCASALDTTSPPWR